MKDLSKGYETHVVGTDRVNDYFKKINTQDAPDFTQYEYNRESWLWKVL